VTWIGEPSLVTLRLVTVAATVTVLLGMARTVCPFPLSPDRVMISATGTLSAATVTRPDTVQIQRPRAVRRSTAGGRSGVVSVRMAGPR
jgi:hypothetical protein